MRPELPFLAAGAIAVTGGAIKAKGMPPNGITAVMGTIVLVILASMTTGTKIAPLVHAVGLLAVLGSVMATISATKDLTKKKGK